MLRIFAKRVTREGQRRLEKVLEKVSCSSTEDVPSPEEAELPSNWRPRLIVFLDIATQNYTAEAEMKPATNSITKRWSANTIDHIQNETSDRWKRSLKHMTPHTQDAEEH